MQVPSPLHLHTHTKAPPPICVRKTHINWSSNSIVLPIMKTIATRLSNARRPLILPIMHVPCDDAMQCNAITAERKPPPATLPPQTDLATNEKAARKQINRPAVANRSHEQWNA
jgi:hypothetical protein